MPIYVTRFNLVNKILFICNKVVSVYNNSLCYMIVLTQLSPPLQRFDIFKLINLILTHQIID